MKRSGHDDNVSGDVAKIGDKSSLHCGFWSKKSFKSNLKLIKSIKMQTCFYQNGLIHDFTCVTERESKNPFELFCEGPLSC